MTPATATTCKLSLFPLSFLPSFLPSFLLSFCALLLLSISPPETTNVSSNRSQQQRGLLLLPFLCQTVLCAAIRRQTETARLRPSDGPQTKGRDVRRRRLRRRRCWLQQQEGVWESCFRSSAPSVSQLEVGGGGVHGSSCKAKQHRDSQLRNEGITDIDLIERLRIGSECC
jgi:hypothetical protein